MYAPIDTILVPQGIEHRTICQGLKHTLFPRANIVPIPVGPAPLTPFLAEWCRQVATDGPPLRVLVMGLCGGLTPGCTVGDVVIYQGCLDGTQPQSFTWQDCDPALTASLQQTLQMRATPVRALTSDRLIHSALEKRNLAEKFGVQVVDMEGFVALSVLQNAGMAVAMIRVVSDDGHHDLPDLTAAFSPTGALRPLPLAVGMVRQPLAAARLVRGSMRGLRKLQWVASQLMQN